MDGKLPKSLHVCNIFINDTVSGLKILLQYIFISIIVCEKTNDNMILISLQIISTPATEFHFCLGVCLFSLILLDICWTHLHWEFLSFLEIFFPVISMSLSLFFLFGVPIKQMPELFNFFFHIYYFSFLSCVLSPLYRVSNHS